MSKFEIEISVINEELLKNMSLYIMFPCLVLVTVVHIFSVVLLD